MVRFRLPKPLASKRREEVHMDGHSNPIVEPPKFEKVTWYREPHLRKLYLLSFFLLIGSATTGFDGMLVNTSQQMDLWKEFFPEVVDTNKLGILINMYNIGSIVSYFITPYLADWLGRKPTIMMGCVIMIGGALLSGLCNNYGSTCAVS
jgi:MFS family permease